MSRSVHTIRASWDRRILGYTIWNNTVDSGFPVVYDTEEGAWDAIRAKAYLRHVDVDRICLGCTVWPVFRDGGPEDEHGTYCPTHHYLNNWCMEPNQEN